MQSWIHALEWSATVRPGLTAQEDGRGAASPTVSCWSDALPRTTTGKVRKREFRQRYV